MVECAARRRDAGKKTAVRADARALEKTGPCCGLTLRGSVRMNTGKGSIADINSSSIKWGTVENEG